jgi:hypothetical protein
MILSEQQIQPKVNSVIVSVNRNQKQSTEIEGAKILLAKEYSTNRRESQPVLCTVVEGNEKVLRGTSLLVHHNRFSEYSPYHLGDNLYSLPLTESIYARIDEKGNPHQMFENILVERLYLNDNPLIPAHLKIAHENKYKVVQKGYGLKKGQIIFCFNFSDYEIIYQWKGVERRAVTVKYKDIVGVKNN